MSLPREPRQKMINMMYLVLTALLALNVSSEILNAFKTVNNSLIKTNQVVGASTNEVMSSLQELKNEPGTRDRASYWLPKAGDIQKYSSQVYDYIQGLKDQILREAGGDPKDSLKRYKEDNLDIATRIMIEKGQGPKLLAMLTEYKKNVLGEDHSIDSAFSLTLPLNLEKPRGSASRAGRSWEGAYFHMVPTVAALTILSKFQNDVRITENKVVTFCHEQVGKVKIRFNQYEAIIGQNSKVLLPGQELEITAGLAAFNSDQKPTVTVGGSNVPLNDKGLAIWKNNVNSSGKLPVRVSFKDQDGTPQVRDFEVEYTVGQSNAAVQLDKLNVLFIGVDNPVTVSGSGSADKLRVGISGGGGIITGGNGHFTARVSSETDNCIISVTTPDNKVTPMKFRVRSIPDPTPMIGTNKGGNIPASQFKSQAGVRAVLENFFYETQFNVTSFRMTGDGEGFENIEEKTNTGAAWNEARSIINKCRPGSFVTIEEIHCVGPDGRNRKLPPLLYYLK